MLAILIILLFYYF